MTIRDGDRFVVGIDLGASQDYTVISIATRAHSERGRVCLFGHIECLPQNMPFERQCDEISSLLRRPMIHGRIDSVAADFTGIGAPVWEMLQRRQLPNLKGVLITGGQPGSATQRGNIHHVPKIDLIDGFRTLGNTGRLFVHPGLKNAKKFEAELQDFRVEYTETGYMKMNAVSGSHDDIVMSVAIAAYTAEFANVSHNNWMEFMRRQAYGGISRSDSRAQSHGVVRLKRPASNTATTLYTMTGAKIDIGPDGTVELPEGEQVIAMLRDGWTHIEAAP
jgi:hypothetical protein